MKQTLCSRSFLSWLAVGAFLLLQPLLTAGAVFSEEKAEPAFPGTLQPRETVVDPRDKGKEPPKAPHMTCGKCPEGYVKTAVAAPESGSGPGASFNATADLCKGTLQSEDATLIECKPIGYQDQMAVCGTCPEGYREVGRTFLPPLCGNEDNGLRTQCQVPNMVGGLPDPTQGGRQCPPDCVGNLPTPGQGTLPPPPKLPGIEIRKEKPEESP
jgi:hypothetical protein